MSYPYTFSYSKDNSVAGYKGPMCIEIANYNYVPSIVEATNSKKLVKASIQRIINTVKGERVMQPRFGSKLRKVLFEPLDYITLQDIKDDLKNIIENDEPRIIVTNIDFKPDIDNHTVYITISTRFKREDIEETFDFYIY